mgnify:CR=1 FL=1
MSKRTIGCLGLAGVLVAGVYFLLQTEVGKWFGGLLVVYGGAIVGMAVSVEVAVVVVSAAIIATATGAATGSAGSSASLYWPRCSRTVMTVIAGPFSRAASTRSKSPTPPTRRWCKPTARPRATA